MPRGARPDERHGGRKEGTPNKFTVGRAYLAQYVSTLDGSLIELAQLLVAAVPNAKDRADIGIAVDRYIAARERTPKRDRRSRSVAATAEAIANPKSLVIALTPLDVSGWDPGSLVVDAFDAAAESGAK